MNKSAEQAKEKYFKERYPRFGPIMSQTDYDAGYNARDEEVKKLVEVLREVERGQYGELQRTFIARITSLAKEALKPYQK